MKIDLLPQPRNIKMAEGVCVVGRLKHVSCGTVAPKTMELMQADLPSSIFCQRPSDGPVLTMKLAKSGSPAIKPEASPLPKEEPEAFCLSILPDYVEIRANGAAGVWQGFQTLGLLIQEHSGKVPCCRIVDWPAIRYRGMHIDLKGYQPTFECLLETIRLLGRYKINAILLELEDKFKYTAAAGIGNATAYSPKQLRVLGELAAAMHMQIIPKVQCLSHVDYLLKHPRYVALRENGHPFQFCSRNPKVHALWRAMALEVMECLPGHKYFHIGADEPWYMNECPVCRKYSKSQNYINAVSKAIKVVQDQGRRPIMWDDVLRNKDVELTDKEQKETYLLGRKAILMYWAYGYGGEHTNIFPMLPTYRREKMQVWGSSGSSCCDDWFENVPELRRRAWNIAAWTKSAVENGLEGVVATCWTRLASFDPQSAVPEACWFHMLYAADSMWSGRSRDPAEFGRICANSFFGVELPEHLAFLMELDPSKLPSHPGRFKAVRQQGRLDLLNAMIETFRHVQGRQKNFDKIAHAYHGLAGDRVVDYRKKLLEDRAKGMIASAERNADFLRKMLGEFYEKPSVDDFIRSRFGRDLEEGRLYLQEAKKSQLI